MAGAAVLTGCSDYREDRAKTGSTDDRALYPTTSQAAVERFRSVDPSLEKFFNNSYGYAVFPKIAKGAAGIGAANGDGEVFEQGRLVGTSEMTQVTIGFQLGGQTYSEIIFFQTQQKLDEFKAGNFEFAANASAIAAESGAGRTNDFSEGLAVFTLPRGGLMFEAAIGGQKFSYTPLR